MLIPFSLNSTAVGNTVSLLAFSLLWAECRITRFSEQNVHLTSNFDFMLQLSWSAFFRVVSVYLFADLGVTAGSIHLSSSHTEGVRSVTLKFFWSVATFLAILIFDNATFSSWTIVVIHWTTKRSAFFMTDKVVGISTAPGIFEGETMLGNSFVMLSQWRRVGALLNSIVD